MFRYLLLAAAGYFIYKKVKETDISEIIPTGEASQASLIPLLPVQIAPTSWVAPTPWYGPTPEEIAARKAKKKAAAKAAAEKEAAEAKKKALIQAERNSH